MLLWVWTPREHERPIARLLSLPASRSVPMPADSIAAAPSIKGSSMPTPRATRSRNLRSLVKLLAFVAWCVPCGAGRALPRRLLEFPPGWLTRPVGQLNGAIQEYHYLPHRGVPLGPWANAICHLDAWAVGDEEGHPYLEQHTVNDQSRLMNPIFLTGDPEWGDYAVEVRVRPLSLDDMAGVVFRYHTNRHYYLFALTGGNRARLAVRLPLEQVFRVASWRELGSRRFPVRHHAVLPPAGGERRVQDPGLHRRKTGPHGRRRRAGPQGKAGVTANIPARFQDFHVTASDEAKARIERADRPARGGARSDCAAGTRCPSSGSSSPRRSSAPGRNVRFGDLDGDGMPEMLIAQNIPRIGDNFIQISCLTAVTFDGKVLWQLGRPDPRNGLLTADTPFQIHDIDGDGRNEVVLVKDFKLQVLEGGTGRLAEVGLDADRLSPTTARSRLR